MIAATDRLQQIAAKVSNARLDWALQSDEPADLIEDLAFVLAQFTAREAALAAIVEQWRAEIQASTYQGPGYSAMARCTRELAALLAREGEGEAG